MRKRSIIITAVATLAIAALVGCGGEKSATAPEVDTVPPATVQGLKAWGNSGPNPSVAMAWMANSESDLAGYRIYRSADQADAVLVMVTTSTSWADSGVENGVEYTYEVSAVDTSENESARSPTKGVVVTATGHPSDVE